MARNFKIQVTQMQMPPMQDPHTVDGEVVEGSHQSTTTDADAGHPKII
jgi:hypothetical protein